MANYVCTQLSNPNLLTGQRTCQTWTELADTPSLIPDLSAQNVSQLTVAFTFFLAVCCIFKLLRRSVK